MKEEKFKVINFTRDLLIIIDTELDNFPKKDIEIKNRLRNNSYDLLELLYLANNTTNVGAINNRPYNTNLLLILNKKYK